MQFRNAILTFLITLFALNSLSADWPKWGRDETSNMVSPEKNIPHDFQPGEFKEDSEEVDLSTTKNIKWVTKLGSECYGNPTVSGGKIFIGTNNEVPRNPKITGDRGVVYCLDEKTGEFLWQLTIPKLGAGKVSDWEFLGICSSPTVVDDRVYIITNRCEVICLDVEGMKNGNDGPYKDEAKYMSTTGQPVEVGETDADIIWVFSMRDELGVFPHNIASSSVLEVNGKLFVSTSNGVDWSHTNIPSPFAPCLIILDAKTGELLGEEGSGIGKNVMHCNWSSPSFLKTDDREQVIFGAGDGFTYGFGLETKKNDEGFDILPELWKYDCNPSEYRMKDGKPIKYATYPGPSEIIATPVVYKNKVYVSIGQDPEHGDGVGNLVCIDPTKSGDITQSGRVWEYRDLRRAISTAAIGDDLLYVADYAGRIHCVDALTGKAYWVHPTESHVWSSPLLVDGKVFLGNEEGLLTIVEHGKELKVLNKIEFPAPIYSSAIAANGVLYLASRTHLYAIENSK